MSKRCLAKDRNGKRCGAWAVTGAEKCALHLDPELAAKMGSKHGRRAALPPQPDAAPMEPPKTASDVRDALANTMAQVHARKMDTRTANALAYLATSLLRAIEVSDLESRLAALALTQRAEERRLLAVHTPDCEPAAGDR
jgi:hypothetical protein